VSDIVEFTFSRHAQVITVIAHVHRLRGTTGLRESINIDREINNSTEAIG